MATITFTIGAITSTKTANNTTAAAVVADFIAAVNGPKDLAPQQQADYFMQALMEYVRQTANTYRKHVVVDQAISDSGINQRDWV